VLELNPCLLSFHPLISDFSNFKHMSHRVWRSLAINGMAINGKAWSVLVLILSFYPVAGLTARDADKPTSPPANKFTLAYYNFSSAKQGFDINLRHTFKTSTAWIGGYGESGGFDQVRAGYEYDYHRVP
jgi:hypothetical protein